MLCATRPLMSAVFSIIHKTEAILAADTLCSFKPSNNDTILLPRSFTCKIFFLPQFKSSFAITGTLQAGLCFFSFMVEFTYGRDIDSLTGISLDDFRSKLKSDYDEYPTGTIYLIGYSLFDETFKGYKLIIGPEENFEWIQIPQGNLMFKPVVDDWDQKLTIDPPRLTYQEFVIDLMKLQKTEDEMKSISNQVGIGGEIVYSYLFIDNESKKFNVLTQIIYQFDDYSRQLFAMGK